MAQPFSTAEKLVVVEDLVEKLRPWRGTPDCQEAAYYEVLKSVAEDLRGRLAGAPTIALVEIERRLAAAKRWPRGSGSNRVNALIGVAEETVARWPIVKQALERFGAEIEQGANADASVGGS